MKYVLLQSPGRMSPDDVVLTRGNGGRNDNARIVLLMCLSSESRSSFPLCFTQGMLNCCTNGAVLSVCGIHAGTGLGERAKERKREKDGGLLRNRSQKSKGQALG